MTHRSAASSPYTTYAGYPFSSRPTTTSVVGRVERSRYRVVTFSRSSARISRQPNISVETPVSNDDSPPSLAIPMATLNGDPPTRASKCISPKLFSASKKQSIKALPQTEVHQCASLRVFRKVGKVTAGISIGSKPAAEGFSSTGKKREWVCILRVGLPRCLPALQALRCEGPVPAVRKQRISAGLISSDRHTISYQCCDVSRARLGRGSVRSHRCSSPTSCCIEKHLNGQLSIIISSLFIN